MKAIFTVAIALTLAGGSMLAQEHPETTKANAVAKPEHPAKAEHPKDKAVAKPEHPAKAEHPKDKAVAKDYSIDDLEQSIKASIADKEKEGGGSFKLADKVTGKTWLLKLDHVHRERLSRLDKKTYFACTDFKTSDGKTVDVDFFMKEKDGKLVMSDTTIHKVDGKARYNWEEKNGFWRRVPVKA